MKKHLLSIIASIVICALLLIGCGGGGGGGSKNPAGADTKILNRFNNATIKNISKYKSLGIGKLNNISSNARANIDNKTTYATFVGLDKSNNKFEIVKFNDESGKEIENNLYVIDFRDFSSFILCQITDQKIGFSENHYNGGYTSPYQDNILMYPFYIIYKPTGKIYSLESFDSINVYTMGCFDETDNMLGFLGRRINDEINGTDYFYTASIENGLLKVERKIDCAKIPNWGTGGRIDRFGNIYSPDFSYIVNTKGKIKSCDKSSWKAMNDIVYFGNKNFNDKGELVDSTFVPDKSFVFNNGDLPGIIRNDCCIKKDGLDYYYYLTNNLNQIIKVSYLDSEKVNYTTSSILLDDYSQIYVIANDKIYFLKNNEIFYVSFIKGKKTSLVSDLIFNSISLNGTNVNFTAVDSNMNDISGIIDSKDNIVTKTDEKTWEGDSPFEVFYVTPLN